MQSLQRVLNSCLQMRGLKKRFRFNEYIRYKCNDTSLAFIYEIDLIEGNINRITLNTYTLLNIKYDAINRDTFILLLMLKAEKTSTLKIATNYIPYPWRQKI